MSALLRAGTCIALGLSLNLQPWPGLTDSLSLQPQALGPEQELHARGARGGGGRGGGFSGGASRSSARGRTGFGGYSNGGSAYRGSRTPSGGFSSGSKPSAAGSRQSQRGATASDRQQSRQATTADRQGQRTGRQEQRTDQRTDRQSQRTDRTDNRQDNRQDNRTERSSNRQEQRTDRVSDRTDVRRDRVDNRWDNYWSGWARPGWGYARPWNYGWYGGWTIWPWWGVGAGFGALATAAIINDAVDDAISNEVTSLVVPETTYLLYYTSIEPVNDDAVTFAVDVGSGVVEMTADCREGTLNGQVPRTQAEAQLLNAACEVAFGKG